MEGGVADINVSHNVEHVDCQTAADHHLYEVYNLEDGKAREAFWRDTAYTYLE